MNSLTVFAQYDGEWDTKNEYVEFKMCGLLLPYDCSLKMLKQLVVSGLKRSIPEDSITIKYQVEKGLPPMVLDCDDAVNFYLELKKQDTTLTRFPLCITVSENGLIERHCAELHTAKSDMMIQDICETNLCPSNEIGSTSYIENGDLPTYIEYAKNFAEALLEEEEAEKENIPKGMNSEIIVNPFTEEIEVGQMFHSKDVLKTALSLYAIKNHFQYRVHKSCKREMELKCIDPSCQWSLRASKFNKTDIFVIRRLYHIHTCSLSYNFGDHRQASSDIIGDLMKKKFLNIKTIFTPGDIMREMIDDHGVSMSYDKAWRSREKALEMVRGKADESYAKLPIYLHQLNETNPGTITDFVTDSTGCFLYMFFALSASIKGWLHCRPVVVVDGTHLTAAHRGTLITACTVDANEHIFPLAFAIVDSENKLAYEWFFRNFQRTFGERPGLNFISDRHDSIIHGIDVVYPSVAHGACIFHLYKNLTTHFKGETVLKRVAFFGAAKAYSVQEFEKHMNKLDKIDKKIRPYLIKVGFEKWSRVHSMSNRYSLMTSNIVESMNATNKAARDLPVAPLVECLRCLVQNWFWKHKQQTYATKTELAPTPYKALRNNFVAGLTMKVEQASVYIFNVKDGIKSVTVNMEERTCSCNRFQMDEMSCPHAMAAIKKRHMNTFEYCSKYYTKQAFLATYEGTVNSVGNIEDWDIPEEFYNMDVEAPLEKRPAGRPRKCRLPSRGEFKKSSTKCGKCGQHGHNKKTCRNMAILKQKKDVINSDTN